MSSSICRRPRSRRSRTGAVVHRYAAIVGDVDHPSPQIAAHVAAINLNPTWTVPVSIIKKEIIPHMQRDPGYLARQKIRILDGSGRRDRSQAHRLDDPARRQLHAAAGFRRRQFARLDPHRHAQQARRLHARHAVEAAVRRRLSLSEPRLRAGAGRLRPRRLAARRRERRAARRLGQGRRCSPRSSTGAARRHSRWRMRRR